MGVSYHCDWAWLGGASATAGVRIDVERDRIVAVRPTVGSAAAADVRSRA